MFLKVADVSWREALTWCAGLEARRGTGPTVLPRDVLPDLTPYDRYRLVNGTDNVPIVEKRGSETVTVGLRAKRQDEGARMLTSPAHTVWSKPGRIYDTHTMQRFRSLTVRECASLQGFPFDFVIEGSKVRSHKVIGNAVPPPLATHIVRLSQQV